MTALKIRTFMVQLKTCWGGGGGSFEEFSKSFVLFIWDTGKN